MPHKASCFTTMTLACGSCDWRASRPTSYQDLHQRHCFGVAEPEDRIVLYRAAACGREPRRRTGATRGPVACTHSDVRRAVEEHAQTRPRVANSAGQLSLSPTQAVRGYRDKLS